MLPARHLPVALLALALSACASGGSAPAPTECTVGATRACYTGPAATRGVGACLPGLQTCTAGGTWPAACAGEVLPAVTEVCGNGADDDCNGTEDDSLDADGDGVTTCGGDCCDVAGPGCPTPETMNPGAFDYPGNGLDEDCSGAPDDAAASCDEGLAGGTDPADLAHAFDLCPAAFGAPAWHIQSAALLRADGLGLPVAGQYAVSGAFGGYLPQAGSALVVLSTGSVAPSGAPGFADFQPGTSRGTTSGFPQDWLAGNGGALPNAPGCPVPMGAVANDPVMFQLYLKVPTNARAFRLKAAFLSAEFPEWTCSPYNDFFVVLLDSSHAGPLANPSDKNLATFTTSGGALYPVGVNLATGSTGLFTACQNGPTGCASGASPSAVSTCTSAAPLSGTGFDALASSGACQAGDQVGGGTGWLQLQGNVVPGEFIRLRVALWDTGDATFDSVALLDAFEWLPDPLTPGTAP